MSRTLGQIWPLVLGISLMGVLGAVNIYVLSAVREYVNGARNWSEGQRDAIVALQAYATPPHDPAHFREYETRVAIPLALREARIALESHPPDYDRAGEMFLRGRTPPEELSGVLLLYRAFSRTPLLAGPIAAWQRGADLIEQVDALATRLHTAASAPVPDEHEIDRLREELVGLHAQLAPLTDDFSGTIGVAARQTAFILHVVTVSCAVGFLLLGAWLSHRQLQRSDRAEREREAARAELDIARTIQASLLLRSPQVPRFEIAGGMTAASAVGGDYYDVLPASDGCWLAVGDVSGHGLNAGLIAMMAQSALSALVTRSPNATPAELMESLNHVLYDNVHRRLGSGDFMTFALLRCHADGRVEWAGAHEPFLVVRASDRRHELVEVIGAWLGVRPDARLASGELRLERGDTLVLHTDGITESRNRARRMFGIDGIEQVVRGLPDAAVERLVRGVLEAAQSWSREIDDDMTVVAVRFTADTGGAS
jgi:serine phosphatase RsbU (regulator of sigma subunit)